MLLLFETVDTGHCTKDSFMDGHEFLSGTVIKQKL
jgi:hypothetical protein